MTKQRRLKKQVRDRMAKTGERYTAARASVVGDQPEQDPPAQAKPDESLFNTTDARVVAATGRSRAEWFAMLDAAGAASMPHRDIARILADEHDVDGWWAQSVTVDYERARGIRAKHEGPGGFSIGKSKTLAVPVADVYAAWTDQARRRTWLGDDLEVSSTQPNKSVRGRWHGGPSRIVVGLVAKGESKTQVQVQHEKLPDAEAAERAKRDWAERLQRLADYVG